LTSFISATTFSSQSKARA